MTVTGIGLAAAGAAALLIYRVIYRGNTRRRRANLIDGFVFPCKVDLALQKAYPHLTERQRSMVLMALREYFHLCNAAGRKMVSMPSQAVDVAWHEFILFTRTYQLFCRRAFGRFLHHTPAEAMARPNAAQEGLRRTWRLACSREDIDPRRPSRLPLLFAIDGDLNIPDGFRYSLDCANRPGEYCAAGIGCGGGGGCGGDTGVDGDGGSGGCGGGCGGD